MEIQRRGKAEQLFVALWHAAISTLLVNVEPADVIDLLEHRTLGIDAHHLDFDSAKEEERHRKIVELAAVISAELETALRRCSSEGLESFFPEAVLDKTMEMLSPRWGAEHLKAALAHQAMLLAGGQGAVFPAREPSPASRAVPDPSARHGVPRPRAVTLRVEANINGKFPVWAFASAIVAADGSGREEWRDGRCQMPGANLARTLMAGMLAALEAIIADGPGCHVVVETSHLPFLAQAESSTLRLAADPNGWSRIDAWREANQIEFRQALPERNSAIAGRCQALLGR